jgi:hypothetical protein
MWHVDWGMWIGHVACVTRKRSTRAVCDVQLRLQDVYLRALRAAEVSAESMQVLLIAPDSNQFSPLHAVLKRPEAELTDWYVTMLKTHHLLSRPHQITPRLNP